jgi:hypothetical protein
MRHIRTIVDELTDRLAQGDQGAIDDLVALDMVNHASGLQGREG